MMQMRWRSRGLPITHAHINWYNGNLELNLFKIEQQVNDLLINNDGVCIIGSSAGASLAFNSYYKLKSQNICAVSAHGRLTIGNFKENDKKSLNQCAHLNSQKPAQSFYDNVSMLQNIVIPQLTIQDKQKLLILTQMIDPVVPKSTRTIQNVTQHKSVAIGHSVGFLAHMMFNLRIINSFANNALSKL